jgi:ankyrin repeat protein
MGDQDFMWAVKNGDVEQVECILKKDPSLATCAFKSGTIPMTVAADYGQNEVISRLIEKGASVDEPDKNGITPILAAIYEGHTETVKYLIGKGANKSGKAPDGSSYVKCAEKEAIVQLLS